MTKEMPSDNDLIRLVAEQDSAAFDLLHNRYKQELRRHLLRMVRDEGAAEDLLQEVFLKLWENAGRLAEHGALKAWVFRVGTNLALNRLRRVRRRKELPLEIPGGAYDEADESFAPGWMVDASSLGPDALAEQAEQRGIIRRLVNELPDGKREAIRLVYDSGMEIREAAQMLGVPSGTVKSRLHYAAKRLARKWEDIEG